MPFTGPMPVVYYSVGGRSPTVGQDGQELPLNLSNSEPYLEWLQYMLAKPDGAIPQVISISYTDTEQTVPRDYAAHVCDLFGRLALRGVSIIDASGDGGVAGQDDVPCISNDGRNRTTFLPTFPASCPWVTAVGALMLSQSKVKASHQGDSQIIFQFPSTNATRLQLISRPLRDNTKVCTTHQDEVFRMLLSSALDLRLRTTMSHQDTILEQVQVLRCLPL